ncbi:MAG: protein-glutamate O-methyltransferase [Aquificae bacterium]|nr:protein-glutamate O-methyltransferase [Aquificota bacterium]
MVEGIGGVGAFYKGDFQSQSKNQLQDIKIQQVVQQLKRIEQKVKAHELAHKTVGGELAGAVRYKYAKGPDGKMYIVGGEVPIKLKQGKNPEETIQIAQKIKQAALAPADPSPQDRNVAAAATMLEIRAKMELAKQEDSQQGNENKISIYV